MPTLFDNKTENKAELILEDGSVFDGIGFGFPSSITGEIVFNTGMVGYTETLTDPSYRGQILCFTYPSIGNYGVPSRDLKDEFGLPKYFESECIQTSGVVVNNYSKVSSHWTCIKTLNEWLYEEKIPAITGVDTRELTKRIRSKGVMNASIVIKPSDPSKSHEQPSDLSSKFTSNEKFDYNSYNFMPEVSTTEPVIYGNTSDPLVVLIDTGTKYSIIRNLIKIGFSVVRLPWDCTIEKIMSYSPVGIVISNGPGDPVVCDKTIATANNIIKKSIPTLGICLGNQILALAAGATTQKLKFGHRGQNKTCVELNSNNSYITSQNHGYGIEMESLKNTDFEIWFKNLDDNTVEGIKHKVKPIIAVQFHPEASPGPSDCLYVFEKFKNLVYEKGDITIG